MNKKARFTIIGMLMTMLLVIGCFIGLFLYAGNLAASSGKSFDPKYSDTYNRLVSTQSNLSENINDIQSNVANITEAPSGFIAAMNGFKGLGSTLLLMKTFVSRGVELASIIFVGTDIIPSWAMTIIQIGLVGTILLIILALWKGEQVTT